MLLSRRHGWQRPLHPLQMIGISVFCFLVAAFYCFLGIFLGNKIAEISVNTVFSFCAFSVALLFIRCSAIDPSDKTRFRRCIRNKNKSSANNFNHGYILSRILRRFFRRMERKMLHIFIRRKYILQMDQQQPLIPFPPLILMDNKSDDAPLTPSPTNQNDISFCSLCDFEVNKYSKHCRTCDRCVQGFDHHCRWLNNCIGKKNYTTFILLMVFVLIMLIVQGGSAIAVFVRCFADIKGIEQELSTNHYTNFPRGLLAAISILLFFVIAYSIVALGQLFFFHVLLIRKGISTYDYILAMKEDNLSMELESLEDSDFSSDESDEFESPERPAAALMSKIICREGKMHQNPQKLVIKIDRESPDSPIANKKQQGGFRASIDPWKLINLSREKALLAAEKAREKLGTRQMRKLGESDDPLKPLPQETKSGLLLVKPDTVIGSTGLGLSPVISKNRGLTSSGQFSSPRRRLSGSSVQQGTVSSSPKHNRYKCDFDLKLTKVSREMETYISRQVLCSVLKNDGGCEASPRF